MSSAAGRRRRAARSNRHCTGLTVSAAQRAARQLQRVVRPQELGARHAASCIDEHNEWHRNECIEKTTYGGEDRMVDAVDYNGKGDAQRHSTEITQQPMAATDWPVAVRSDVGEIELGATLRTAVILRRSEVEVARPTIDAFGPGQPWFVIRHGARVDCGLTGNRQNCLITWIGD